jgi:hypothetical protein
MLGLGSLCSLLAGRYDNPIPTRFLALIDCSKIPAKDLLFLLFNAEIGRFLTLQPIYLRKQYTKLYICFITIIVPFTRLLKKIRIWPSFLIYVFPEMKLRSVFLNSYIHVSVSDL